VAGTSAWARAGNKEVAPKWRKVVQAGELIACAPVTMEMIFDAPDRDAVERVAVAMAGFRQAPISRSVTDAATWAMRELAQRGAAGAHRVRVAFASIVRADSALAQAVESPRAVTRATRLQPVSSPRPTVICLAL